MRRILKLAFLLFFILPAVTGYPEDPELVILYVGEVKVLPVNTPTRVVINNPDIIDVTSVSKEDMLVAAKSAGTTNLIWWDKLGQHALQARVFAEDMRPVKQRIDALLKELDIPGVLTQASDSEGKVLLLGEVKTPQDLERIEVALGALKGKTVNLIQLKEERASIEIEAMVLELKKDASKTLGLAWPTSTTLTEPSGRRWGTLAGIPDALFRISNWTRGTFTATLDFLVKEGSARVLSRPRLVCQSGKEAELLVGGEKPILTTTVAATTGAQGTSVDYKEYGIKLKIKPKLAPEDKVQLTLNVEVSDVGTVETLGTTTSPTAKAYPLTKRSTSTQVYLNDGQTMAISGLIRQKTEEELQKFPWLADVPVLGVFFRHKTFTSGGGRGELGDTELVVTLTPRIVKEPQAADKEEIASKEKPQEIAQVPAKETVKQQREEVKAKKEKPKIKPPATVKETVTKKITKARISAVRPEAQVISEYIPAIARRIQDNFVYPWAAKEANLEGSLKLGLRLYYTGQLLDVKIRESSGYAVLDENAVSIVRKLAPYPPFPAQIKRQKELWIDLPIVYKTK
jgi:pilus assembly protein CpaC